MKCTAPVQNCVTEATPVRDAPTTWGKLEVVHMQQVKQINS